MLKNRNHEAAETLGALLEKVQYGEEVLIRRNGNPYRQAGAYSLADLSQWPVQGDAETGRYA